MENAKLYITLSKCCFALPLSFVFVPKIVFDLYFLCFSIRISLSKTSKGFSFSNEWYNQI